MASFGTVVDLFNDRELHLQDVYGNVEPLCTLMPYEEYKHNVLVYCLDSSAEAFVSHLQTLTEHQARKTASKEIWTWCVQWKVGSDAAQQPLATRHLTKKPRLGSAQPNASTVQPSRRTAGAITARPRVIPAELIKKDDMQRILVDIVQVNTSIVPNFIEFLYRWIDFYLGDGRALKAALFGEIPSLWDFERHPRTVPDDIKKRIDSETYDMTATNLNAEEVAMNSPTRTLRERPDLAALERKAEESERLQYREVRFGMQPPSLDEPLPPLINIPRDDDERARYYAACFKSRQRAFYMLTDAGVTPQNMRDYIRGQEENVKDTPFRGGFGLFNYERDAKMTQVVFAEDEAQLKKQREIAISNRLAEEAQALGYRIMPNPSGVPLVPPMSSRTQHHDVATEFMLKLRAARPVDVNRISVVPDPLVGKMNSEMFRDAMDRDTMIKSLMSRVLVPPRTPVHYQPGLGSNAAGNGGISLPRPPELPPLPRPNLPPLPQPYQIQTNPGEAFGNGIGLPTPRPPTPGIPSPLPAPGFPPIYLPPGALPPGMSPPRLPPDFPLMFPSLGSEQLASTSGTVPPHLQLGFGHQPSASGAAPPPGFAPGQQPPVLGTAPGLPPQGFPLQLPVAQREPNIFSLESSLNYSTQQQGRHMNFPPPVNVFPPPSASMQRNAPAPLNLAPPPSPFSSLPASMLATSPLAAPQATVAVQIYFPRVVVPANIIGPGGAKLGNGGCAETDAILIGSVKPGSGEIQINRAVFLPMGIWPRISEMAREKRGYTVETFLEHASGQKGVPHQVAYEKLKQAYNFIIRKPDDVRERELTKRWRVTNGPMTETKRGAIWEGWAAVVDREIKITKPERTGAVMFDSLINGRDEAWLEKEARLRELEALMEEEEALDDSDDNSGSEMSLWS
ncbi:uncharacterized protein yc1106_04038 [Curvularia clavata]|uniref:Uncharacterized protein n=1 Tax=Curvularia clavata TaxID=95742 RepID=A0A9Q9DSH5_CURCL|nr:uncharacterized protein yc1106_04038 [Curvularia clavata]